MKVETLKKLRNGKPLKLFKPYNGLEKHFIHIQLNKKADFVCWQRFVSKDRKNWIEVNSYLSLQDINNYLKS